MTAKRYALTIELVTVSLLVMSFILAGCGPNLAPSAPTPTQAPMSAATLAPVPPTVAPTPLPTLAPYKKSTTEFMITDFDAVHSPVNNDANEHLIFGAIPISQPQQNLAPELAAFLGRWEGYDFSPPVKKDYKV